MPAEPGACELIVCQIQDRTARQTQGYGTMIEEHAFRKRVGRNIRSHRKYRGEFRRGFDDMNWQMTPRDGAEQLFICAMGSRQTLSGHPRRLYIERFASPENNVASFGLHLLFLITSGNEVGRELRSDHLKA